MENGIGFATDRGSPSREAVVGLVSLIAAAAGEVESELDVGGVSFREVEIVVENISGGEGALGGGSSFDIVDDHLLGVGVRPEDVVFDGVVFEVKLKGDLAAVCLSGVVAKEGVVADLTEAGFSAILIVSAHDDPGSEVVMEEVVSEQDMIGESSGMFTGEFDAEVAPGDEVSGDGDVCAAIDVDSGSGLIAASGGEISAIAGVEGGVDIVNFIATANSIAGAVERVGKRGFTVLGIVFVADKIDADIIAMVDVVLGYEKVGDVSIDRDGFALPGAEFIDLVVFYNESVERGGLCAVAGDAKSVSVFGGVVLVDVVDFAVGDFDAAAGAFDLDADGDFGGTGGHVVFDLEVADGDVVAVQNFDESGASA